MTNSSIRSIIIYINQISICRCSLMVKFELPKLASRVRFPSPAPKNHPRVERVVVKKKSHIIGEGANLGVSYHRRTPRKPLSRCIARSAAPKAALIAGYSLHLLHTKKQTVHPSVFLYIMKWELNPRRKPYNRRGDESGCILS